MKFIDQTTQVYKIGHTCPLCGQTDIKVLHNADDNNEGEENGSSIYKLVKYGCPNCGQFVAPIFWQRTIKDSEEYPKARVRQYLFYTQDKKTGRIRIPVFCTAEEYKNEVGEDAAFYNVTPQILEKWYPKTLAERIDMILLKIAELSPYMGADVTIAANDLEKLYFVHKNEFAYLKEEQQVVAQQRESLLVRGQIEYIDNYFCNQLGYNTYECGVFQLTPKAWERVYELQKKEANNKKAFVAMKFGAENDELYGKIKAGLNGFVPVRMNEHEHNNQIIPEMLYQIDNCKFMVAELSDNNNGVYYEAGYAKGIGKEVIFLCNEEVMKSGIHFDVAQANIITYRDINDIPDKLQKRIEATIN